MSYASITSRTSDVSMRPDRPPLSTLMPLLSAQLHAERNAPLLRRVEVTFEHFMALDERDQRRVDAATASQRASIGGLLERPSNADRDVDLARTMASLDCAVDIVATWPNPEPPELERLSLRHARCDLAHIAHVCGDAFAALAGERKLALEIIAPPELPAVVDPAKVQHIVLNLLFNAVKVTPIGGAVDLRLEHQASLGEAVITVVDGGTGVAPDMHDLIFTRSRRADRGGPIAQSWLGFNLGASRDYARLHGGGLRLVARRPGTGAEFRAHLPLQPPPGTAETGGHVSPELAARVARVAAEELDFEGELGTHAPSRHHRPLVLVVEDSRVIQQVVARALDGQCNLAAAFDGRTGLAMAIDLVPDLIITDLGLPELDGTEMVRAIRERPQLANVSILVVSARRDSMETVQLLRHGVQDMVNKPFAVHELRARVDNLLDAKRARDVLGELLGERESNLARMATEVKHNQERLKAALVKLDGARELAESANRVKSNFLRMMSHELKTPVSALVLQLQLLGQTQQSEHGPPQARRVLDGMTRSISRLMQIVDTMLEWARVESGRFSPVHKEGRLEQIVEAAVRAVRPRATNKGLVLDVVSDTDLPAITTDARLLELIVVNLLARAISVTGDGAVAIRLEHDGAAHVIRLTDRGPSLSGEQQRHLLDALGPRRDLLHDGGFGSGVELHIVRDLVHALDGEILTDQCDTGLEVRLVLRSPTGLGRTPSPDEEPTCR